MNDLEEPWIDIKSYLLLFGILLNNMLSFSLIKRKNLLLSLNAEYYFFLFFVFLSNFFLKIMSIIDLTATHYVDNTDNDFELLYVNIFHKLNFRFFFKIFLKKEDLVVSISELFKSTAWLEREVWDLFGLKFIYHEDLRRILTDYGFLGHPLQKQFPLIGFIEIRYDDSILNILKEAVEMSQMYRFFRFINPWFIWK